MIPKVDSVGEREAIGRRRRRFDDRLDATVSARERVEDLAARDDAVRRPAAGAADVHVFDEAHFGAELAAELDQIAELVVVHAANHDRVDLEAGREHAMRSGEAVFHFVERVDAREREEAIAAQRVEAHGDASEPGRLQPVDLIREQDAVRRQREIAKAGLRRHHRDERRQVAAEQRLAAGEANLVHAEADEDVDKAADLLEMQHVLARQPGVVVLRHAVFAAQVAAVGDRQAQVAQRTAEAIGEHESIVTAVDRRDPIRQTRLVDAVDVVSRATRPAGTRAVSAPARLSSLDAFRGATIAAMVIVNNPGTWSAMYWPLEHAEWNGWTPTDLIFPFFLVIVGVSITLSQLGR